MLKITRRFDHFLRENLTFQTFLAVALTILFLLGIWAIILNVTRGLGFPAGPGTAPLDQAQRAAQQIEALRSWLAVLLAPAVLVLAAIWILRKVLDVLDRQASRRLQQESALAEARRQTELKIAQDSQRESALRDYFLRMEDYLLSVGSSPPDQPESRAVRDIARLRTITLLRSLDRDRLNRVFQFLRDAGLASTLLVDADLQNINLEGVNLSQIRLANADLRWSNLQRAYLRGADLSLARLNNCDLSRAILQEASLLGADLSMADLTEANLLKVDLSKANLNGANLTQALLSEATLVEVDFSQADVIGSDFTGADLSGAVVSEDQLRSAASLSRVTLPNGREIRPEVSLSSASVDPSNWRRNRVQLKRIPTGAKASNWQEISARVAEEIQEANPLDPAT